MSNHLYDALIAPNTEGTSCFLETDKEEISFAAFTSSAAQMAHVLVDMGVKPGDRVLVQAPKCAEMVMLYAATLQAGAVFLPLNTAYTRDELAYFVGDAAPSMIVCAPSAESELSALAKAGNASVLTLDKDGSGTLSSAAKEKSKHFETVARDAEDLAALLYTSGTTGRSKGAMLSHANLSSNAQSLVTAWELSRDDVLVHALPIFHTHGLFVALNAALMVGMRVKFMNAFDIDKILAALPVSTLMMGVPTFYTRLLADDRFGREVANNMRLFISGSAPLLAETHEAFTARTEHQILERYGMTETNMNTSNPYRGARVAGSVGMPLEGVEVRVTDPSTGAPLPDGEIGMIEVRGPNVFKGYWKMPEKTAEELRENGFFISGDLGQFDENGYLSIVGRQKDLIITGGYNVYPKEIEDVLNDVDGVRESAVFGVPDADFGEKIIAACVAETNSTIDQSALETALAEKLARFKHPRAFQTLESLPRNAMGKVQKNILRDSFDG
ncbi:MAG: malonyl-CoA synthase [Paracoccaceae bacterium]